MAQLKDLIVNGASRFIGDAYTNKIQITAINAPTTSNGTTYGPGTNGQVLTSNGTSIYWTDTNLSNYVNKSGDTMTGALTVNGLKGTSNVDYGETLPASGTTGQIFFQTSDPYYELPAGGSAGQALIKSSASDRDVTWGSVGGVMTPNNSTKYYVSGSTSTSENTNPAIFNTAIYVNNSVLFGAAWNDYAEYRESSVVEPGRCVIEKGDDTLILSSKRIQPGAEIISDTFGFAIGQTEKAQTPIATSGRVLAYPYESLEEFKNAIGRPVCSGPNGTVSIMTDEEYQKFGYCAIGTISAVPEYETWGENNVIVNNRVWIRVR